MSRKIFVDGDILYSSDVNEIAYPRMDGEDFIGHGELIADANLSNASTEIKAKFYAWYERFKVTTGIGLSINVSGGLASDRVNFVNLPATTLNLFDNQVSYVFIEKHNSSLRFNTASSLPNVCIPLARVSTVNGAVEQILDLRQPQAEVIPYEIQQSQQVPVGSCILSFLPGSVPDGYLECLGQAVSRTTYSALFAAIGSTYGVGDGSTTFNLPNTSNRFIFMNQSVGSTGGSNSVTLSTANLPPHSHQIDDPTHTHGIYQEPHSHNISQVPHSHNVSDPGHGHFIQLPASTDDRSEGSKPATGSIGNDTPLQGNTFLATTGISVNTSNANITINPINANVALVSNVTGINGTRNTGSGTPIDITPAYFGIRAFIKF